MNKSLTILIRHLGGITQEIAAEFPDVVRLAGLVTPVYDEESRRWDQRDLPSSHPYYIANLYSALLIIKQCVAKLEGEMCGALSFMSRAVTSYGPLGKALLNVALDKEVQQAGERLQCHLKYMTLHNPLTMAEDLPQTASAAAQDVSELQVLRRILESHLIALAKDQVFLTDLPDFTYPKHTLSALFSTTKVLKLMPKGWANCLINLLPGLMSSSQTLFEAMPTLFNTLLLGVIKKPERITFWQNGKAVRLNPFVVAAYNSLLGIELVGQTPWDFLPGDNMSLMTLTRNYARQKAALEASFSNLDSMGNIHTARRQYKAFADQSKSAVDAACQWLDEEEGEEKEAMPQATGVAHLHKKAGASPYFMPKEASHAIAMTFKRQLALINWDEILLSAVPQLTVPLKQLLETQLEAFFKDPTQWVITNWSLIQWVDYDEAAKPQSLRQAGQTKPSYGFYLLTAQHLTQKIAREPGYYFFYDGHSTGVRFYPVHGEQFKVYPDILGYMLRDEAYEGRLMLRSYNRLKTATHEKIKYVPRSIHRFGSQLVADKREYLPVDRRKGMVNEIRNLPRDIKVSINTNIEETCEGMGLDSAALDAWLTIAEAKKVAEFLKKRALANALRSRDVEAKAESNVLDLFAKHPALFDNLIKLCETIQDITLNKKTRLTEEVLYQTLCDAVMSVLKAYLTLTLEEPKQHDPARIQAALAARPTIRPHILIVMQSLHAMLAYKKPRATPAALQKAVSILMAYYQSVFGEASIPVSIRKEIQVILDISAQDIIDHNALSACLHRWALGFESPYYRQQKTPLQDHQTRLLAKTYANVILAILAVKPRYYPLLGKGLGHLAATYHLLLKSIPDVVKAAKKQAAGGELVKEDIAPIIAQVIALLENITPNMRSSSSLYGLASGLVGGVSGLFVAAPAAKIEPVSFFESLWRVGTQCVDENLSNMVLMFYTINVNHQHQVLHDPIDRLLPFSQFNRRSTFNPETFRERCLAALGYLHGNIDAIEQTNIHALFDRDMGQYADQFFAIKAFLPTTKAEVPSVDHTRQVELVIKQPYALSIGLALQIDLSQEEIAEAGTSLLHRFAWLTHLLNSIKSVQYMRYISEDEIKTITTVSFSNRRNRRSKNNLMLIALDKLKGILLEKQSAMLQDADTQSQALSVVPNRQPVVDFIRVTEPTLEQTSRLRLLEATLSEPSPALIRGLQRRPESIPRWRRLPPMSSHTRRDASFISLFPGLSLLKTAGTLPEKAKSWVSTAMAAGTKRLQLTTPVQPTIQPRTPPQIFLITGVNGQPIPGGLPSSYAQADHLMIDGTNADRNKALGVVALTQKPLTKTKQIQYTAPQKSKPKPHWFSRFWGGILGMITGAVEGFVRGLYQQGSLRCLGLGNLLLAIVTSIAGVFIGCYQGAKHGCTQLGCGFLHAGYFGGKVPLRSRSEAEIETAAPTVSKARSAVPAYPKEYQDRLHIGQHSILTFQDNL